MKTAMILIIVLAAVAAISVIFSFVLFMYVFYSRNCKKKKAEFEMPPGREYVQYEKRIREWARMADELEYVEASTKSFDGLTLYAKYYEFYKGAPIEIMFHGYRGDALRDLSAGLDRAKRVFHNVLLVDQRGSGRSDGHVITFGIREHKDCIGWIDYTVKNISADAKIILTGISMGAATVLMASGRELHPNVIGVLADCGYTSAEKIIKKVIKDMKLPPKPLYPFVALGARLFGGFSLSEYSPEKAMETSTLPIIFFHGDGDRFVPMSMSVENYNICTSAKKELVIMEKAGHGLCFMVDEEKYVKALESFFGEIDGTEKIRRECGRK